jgi:F0F1-type ATP synthase beta subunit
LKQPYPGCGFKYLSYRTARNLTFELIAPRGFEPLETNQQSLENKELTENTNPVFATSLAKTLQKYPELEQIITAWPELPEAVKTTIKALIQTHKVEKK